MKLLVNLNTTICYTLLLASTAAAEHYLDSRGILRDSYSNRIHRSSKAKRQFRKKTPCPSTGKIEGACSGYVIDHIYPLKRGGADSPENMQWQTRDDAKLKDTWE